MHRRDNERLPHLHEILKGEVASIQSYGAFMKLEGYDKQGLVHVSQISSSKVDDPNDVLEKGESIWCKVISISDGKVGLSMKLVNQTTGSDLDPANVQAAQDEQKRRTGHRHDKAPISLEAVYDTKCRKCGGSGHLSQDCFFTPGGKTYELLEEEARPIFAGPNQLREDQQKHTHKHSKKQGKEKKKKKKRKHESSDSDSDTPKKRKEKKKKRKHSKDESGSDSDEPRRKQKKDKHKKKKHRHSSESSY